jgi:hypothetical protein
MDTGMINGTLNIEKLHVGTYVLILEKEVSIVRFIKEK